MLWTEDGRPRVAIVSIAHLGDRERMFVVSLLLSEILAWTRTLSGTTGLRALIYMDELYGYLPPVAEPPSKRPMLALLKQARAFGVGLLLSTQNPIDIDYKALGNIGTWFLGRLQTERDKKRLLDGLEAAQAGAGSSRRELDHLLGQLPGQVFLLRNVHAAEPVVFKTRWVLSYLKGPLTRNEIRRLSGEPPDPGLAADTEATAPSPLPPGAAVATRSEPQALPPEIQVRFEPGPPPGESPLRPSLLATAEIRFEDDRKGDVYIEELVLTASLPEDPVDIDWGAAKPCRWHWSELQTTPPAHAAWGELPRPAAEPSTYRRWERDLRQYLFENHRLRILHSPSLGVTSAAGETERSFRIRLAGLAREARTERLDHARRRVERKLERIEERIATARRAVEKQEGQLRDQQLRTAISAGETVLGAIFGRRSSRRASTAIRGASRTRREVSDVRQAKARLEELESDREALQEGLATELDTIRETLGSGVESLEERWRRPLRRNVDVHTVALFWRT